MTKKHVVNLDLERKKLEWLQQREDGSNANADEYLTVHKNDGTFRFEYHTLANSEQPDSDIGRLTDRIIEQVDKGIASISELIETNPRAARLLREGGGVRVSNSPFKVKEKSGKRKLRHCLVGRGRIRAEDGDFYSSYLTFGNFYLSRNDWRQQTYNFGLDDFLENDKRVSSRRDKDGLCVEGVQHRAVSYPINSWASQFCELVRKTHQKFGEKAPFHASDINELRTVEQEAVRTAQEVNNENWKQVLAMESQARNVTDSYDQKLLDRLKHLGWDIRIKYRGFNFNASTEEVSVMKDGENLLHFIGRVDKDQDQILKEHRKAGNTYISSGGQERIPDNPRKHIPDQTFSAPAFICPRIGRYSFIEYDAGNWLNELREDIQDLKSLPKYKTKAADTCEV